MKSCKCNDKKYESETIANKKESSYIGCKIDDKCSNYKMALNVFDSDEVKNGEKDGWTNWLKYDMQHNAECFPVKKTGIIEESKEH